MPRKTEAAPVRPQPASAARFPVAALAAALLRRSADHPAGLVYVARSGRQADQVAQILRSLAPEKPVLLFPPWDCMPYDRAPPSAEVMTARIAVLRRLAEGVGERFLLVTTAEALLQRVPPPRIWAENLLELRVGSAFDPEALKTFLARTGYVIDERVDEPGEAALRGAVVDLFPGGDSGPVRIDHADGAITGIRFYDPLTQRTLEEAESLLLAPASELVLPPPDPDSGEAGEAVERPAGLEHSLPEYYEELVTLLDYVPDAAVIVDPGAEERRDLFLDQVADAFAMRQSPAAEGHGGATRRAAEPHRLYLDREEWSERLAQAGSLEDELRAVQPVPQFAREAKGAGAFRAFVRERREAGDRVILAAAAARDRAALLRALGRAREDAPEEMPSWAEALQLDSGRLMVLRADLPAGFLDAGRKLAVVAAADLLGSRAGPRGSSRGAEEALGIVETEYRVGDAVIHMDHGMARLAGIEEVETPGGPKSDAVVLEFAAGGKLLAPAEDIGRIWRYGADAEAVTLDRIGGTSWPKRRAELNGDIARIARELTGRAAARLEAKAPELVPPAADYERFAAAFPFSETPDQLRAIEDVLADLGSGRPMNRLVCGDVGYGKTEVALRAAAAAVLGGKQVAVVAPTTVLVRQHVRTFRRRFAGFGIEVAHLSRLVSAAEARAVKQGLASGDTPLVVGTQALAGKGVSFDDLGLLIIDEEHRFGTRQKEALQRLGEGVHVLTLTATPIPRTLQTALVGLQDLSTIATPPVRRQPIRTFLAPLDPVTVRSALMRERRRGGQSFVVCPRVEDIEPMAARLKELVPELATVVAHGKMPADAMDAAMVDFADGVGDVLLATNIVETGLDVPRANTMLIWRADRFGLAQLHQLRGRVGRGRLRGTCYLLTDPAAQVAPATEARLRTLTAMDRLGSGFAISARDLDLRGAGDLVGEEQAGHVKLIGMPLYRHLLDLAVRTARGEAVEDWAPELRLGIEAFVPADYIPEADIRINLLARLSRDTGEGVDAVLEEIEDRFGPAPEPVRNLVAVAGLRALCRLAGVTRMDAGPAALALTFRNGAAESEPVRQALADPANGLDRAGERLIRKRAGDGSDDVLEIAASVLEAIRPA